RSAVRDQYFHQRRRWTAECNLPRGDSHKCGAAFDQLDSFSYEYIRSSGQFHFFQRRQLDRTAAFLSAAGSLTIVTFQRRSTLGGVSSTGAREIVPWRKS